MPIGPSATDIIFLMRFLRFIIFLFFAGILAGCGRPSETESAAPASTATEKSAFPRDDLGREVNLKAPAKRVVCIGPGATETIFALGAGSKLVGRDQISDYPKETSEIPIVGDYTGPFVEKAIAVKPDLVIVQGETYDKSRADNWQSKIGVPVAVLVPMSVHRVAYGIQKLGVWLGIEKESQKLFSKFNSHLVDRGLEGEPKGFFEVQRSPLWTAGKDTLIGSVMGKAGVANLALGISGYKQYNVESLLNKEPDLFIVAEANPNREKVIRELKSHPVLKKLKCVNEGRVIVLPADWLLRPGPRLLQGIEALKREAAPIEPQQYP